MLLTTPPLGYERSPLGLLTPIRPRRRLARPVAIDLFAGAGGFSMGFHQAGFQVIAAMDMDHWSAITYMVNLGRSARWGGVQMHYDSEETADKFDRTMQRHLGIRGKGVMMSASAQRDSSGKLIRGPMLAGNGWISGQDEVDQQHGCEHYFLGDIRAFTGAKILDAIGVDQDDVAAIIGGPPCQGFSLAGKRNVMDPRNSLVFEFARLICEIRPRTFVMENVPEIENMVTPEGVPVLDALCVAISEGGYGEYDSLRRALSGTAGRAAVRDAKRAQTQKTGRPRRDQKPTAKAKAAARAAQEPQPSLFDDKGIES